MNVKLFAEKDEYLLFAKTLDINNDRAKADDDNNHDNDAAIYETMKDASHTHNHNLYIKLYGTNFWSESP